ncbi:MAG: RidA family protein [Chromatiales bacterium]|jgi:enamine deaminase RidA (YjgF/YER057c/UK114 family)
MDERRRYSTGTVWEQTAAYSRALQVGPHIYVAGTTAVDASGRVVGRGDIARQFHVCIDRIEQALAHFGAARQHIVRTRVYLTDIGRFEDYARAHGECFRGIEPVNTMVEVSALVHPDMLIEVEVDAYLPEDEAA